MVTSTCPRCKSAVCEVPVPRKPHEILAAMEELARELLNAADREGDVNARKDMRYLADHILIDRVPVILERHPHLKGGE